MASGQYKLRRDDETRFIEVGEPAERPLEKNGTRQTVSRLAVPAIVLVEGEATSASSRGPGSTATGCAAGWHTAASTATGAR